MRRKELNSEIQKILSNLPDESLKSVLEYLQEVKNIGNFELKLSRNLGKILSEDAELLKQLAQ